MSLHIVLGFDSPKSSAEPTVVYAGRSGEAARAAMAASTAATFGILTNPQPLRKNNPRAAANRAALDPEAQKAAALAAEQARLEAEGQAAELREQSRLKAIAIAKSKGVAEAAVQVVLDAIAQAATGIIEGGEVPHGSASVLPLINPSESPLPAEAVAAAAPISNLNSEIPPSASALSAVQPSEPSSLDSRPSPESSDDDSSENHFAEKAPARRSRRS